MHKVQNMGIEPQTFYRETNTLHSKNSDKVNVCMICSIYEVSIIFDHILVT